MAKEQVEWVGLDDVMIAADRDVAPLGPEFAGFVVLEAALRARELGGIVDATTLAIGTSGHVALTAQPRSGDERLATRTLRALLSDLLAVAATATPALRACARRRDGDGLLHLVRELEGALIPLNRAASRRGVARVARITLEALTAGLLDAPRPPKAEEPSTTPAPTRPIPPPLPKVIVAKGDEPVVAPVEEDDAVEATESKETTEVDDRTPYAAPVFDATGSPPVPMAALDEPPEEDGGDIEIVSQLPPLAEEDASRGFALARDVSPPPTAIDTSSPSSDRVAELVARFEVSRRRDDPALSRDLKAMVGIETSAPPPVMVRVRLDRRGEPDDDFAIEHDPLEIAASDRTPVTRAHAPKGRRAPSIAAFFALGVVGCLVGTAAVRPSSLDRVFGAAAAPPGEKAGTTAMVATPPPAMAKLPTVCEATLALEGVAPGSEVLRRLGAMPLSVAMPMGVPIDLVATLDSGAPRRARVEANAAWQQEATGPRFDVAFTLDTSHPVASTDASFPPGNPTPLRAPADARRGVLRASSTPSGAILWVDVDPASVSFVPCGATVDLLVVPPRTANAAAPKPVHVEWSAFSGAPPRATVKLRD